MLGEERREYILNIINDTGSINAKKIAAKLKVSEATIRRDLNKLSQKNLVKRTYGGAIRTLSVGREMSFNTQKEINIEEKKKIGMAAAQMIEEGDVIIIESGTTGYHTALNIRGNKNLTIITNGCEVASILSKITPDYTIILSGGIFNNETHSLIGPIADNTFTNVNVDKAFIGITGLDIDKGITAVNQIEAATKKNIIKSANQVIALADHSKLGHISVNFVSDISSIDILITDHSANKSLIDQIKKSGITVIQK
ncbi:MAG: DeoR/GlpR family DNA-binding transcription regulator [Actinomycetia bacterium]|nr:DeoR/GlpR family DNA-binding transcription regulator [Actinomycetes bacterium]